MLRKTLAPLLLLFSVATAYGIQGQTEWVKFTSPKGLFSLMSPHEAKLETDPDSTAEKSTHQRFNDFEEGYGFVVEYFENAPIGDTEKYLDGTSEGIRKVVKGTLLEENKISLDGHPGRELLLSFAAENGTLIFSRTRIYVVDTNLFSISYVWRKDTDPAAASKIGERFFSSLKLKPRE
jgi:hypothetical protein